jgi:hypothetical protein
VKHLNAERTAVGLPHPEQKAALEHKLIVLSVHVTESFQGNAFKSEQGPTNKLRPVHVVTPTHRGYSVEQASDFALQGTHQLLGHVYGV